MIGDTMETDIRGALEADMQAYLVLTGSTPLDSVNDYVYQPTRVLASVADLTAEISTGTPSDRLDSPVILGAELARKVPRSKHTIRSQPKPRLRPAMTK
jgi:NagD protein